jgi:hypothetical protein
MTHIELQIGRLRFTNWKALAVVWVALFITVGMSAALGVLLGHAGCK